MPQTSAAHKKPRTKVDTSLFSPSLLSDEVALECAVSVFEGHLQSSTEEMCLAFTEVMDYPNLLEYLLSVMNTEVFDRCIRQLLELFPQEASQFPCSIGATLLSRLSHYYWTLGSPLATLDDHFRTVQLAPQVLSSLATAVLPSSKDTVVMQDDESPPHLIVQTQRDRKKARRNRKLAVTLDRRPFEKLDISIPQTREEADIVEQALLVKLKDMLKYHLEGLRDPSLAELIKSAYILDDAAHAIDATESGMDGQNLEPQAIEPSAVPLAYPFIQPIKAAFYFDSIDGFGEWRILISTRADRNLREARKKNRKLFGIILKKIKELSNGHFSDDNQKRLAGSDIDIPIFEAKMTGDTRLVYIVDCVKEFDSEVERQVLRVFGIYTHAQLDRRFWDAVSQHLAGKGKEYRRRCIFRRPPIHKGDKVIPPAIFTPMEVAATIASPTLPNLRNEDREELHVLLVLEKFVTFSQALLNSILADHDAVHVFQMSPAEQEIVKHGGSCYVLGRSGTGKTTTMLFKMLGIERTWESMREDLGDNVSKPRQAFITQSRVLAERVEEYYSKLTKSHIAAQRTAEESVALAAAKNDRRSRGLVNRDEEEFYRGTLPKRFADLKDEHFPLFLTFDHLCRLLEAHVKDGNKYSLPSANEESRVTVDDGMPSSDYMLQRRDAFVSYDTFLKSYWPHLPQSLTKGLDPALVFAEFMGVIKGSEQTLGTENGYLERDAYVDLSHRQQGTFASRRGTVYSLFQAYSKLKRSRGEWDAADRTHLLLRGLGEVGIPGSKLDFIYIDEAQDNLLVDALVLRMLCRNPDGFFWAGDTAQTISVGSSFRFNDLKSFLYRLEATTTGSTDLEVPRSFQLTVNYRSHGGIVCCAHSVVQLITKFWPYAIDSLGEEQGIVDGLKPVFFSGWDQDTVQYEQFLFGTSGSQIEFGAKQCILVRDDAARAKLRSVVGDIGLVLTLYESKGLEFDDVLLYNFFEDSHVDVSQWRVVLNALPEDQKTSRMKCPQFDETRHSGICRELKFLYVAITRARKNLWIADCSERAQPLKMLWKSLDLINECTSADEAPRLATTSTSEEWADTAENLFDHGRYSQAMRCYERASMFRESDIAHAYYLREQAKLLPVTFRSGDSSRIAAYVEAAAAFQKSAVASTNRNEIIAYNRIVGDCFVEIGEYAQAAAAYRAAEQYTQSAQLYRKAGLFDNAVEVVRAHGDDIPAADADNIFVVAKLHYFKQHHLKHAIDLFPSFDEALEFMEDCGFDADRAKLLEEAGRLAEAAECHLLEGRVIEAIELLLRDASNTSSKMRAEEHLLNGLWRQLSFRVTVHTEANLSNSLLDQLLAIATRMMEQCLLSSKGRDEVAMFQAIANSQISVLQLLGEKFYNVHGDIIAAILCFDRVFSRNLKIRAASCREIASMLQWLVIYAQELSRIAYESDPANEPALERLFGFQRVDESGNDFHVPAGTFLHDYALRGQAQIDPSQDLPQSAWELKNLIRKALCDMLLSLVRDENSQCHDASALQPCPPYAVFGVCNSNSCTRARLESQAMDKEWYITRIRIHFQQVLIYQAISPLENKYTIAREQRFWLSRLYHALHPVHQQLGSSSIGGLFSFPEAEKGIPILRNWIRDAFYNLSPWTDETQPHFLTIIAELSTLAFEFEKNAARSYISGAQCVAHERPLALLRNGGQYIVHDLLLCLEGVEDNSISAGVLCLLTICNQTLTFDLNVLCHLVDYISSSLVVCYRLQRYGSIHDTTLMREWVLRLCGEMGQKQTHLLSLFLQPMTELISEVYSGKQGFLLFEGGFRIDYQQRNIFVARIFRSLVLLGYNIPNFKLRWDIQQIITSIYRPDRHYPWILNEYVTAKSWSNLVRALRSSTSPRQRRFDELVQVKDRKKCHGPVRPLNGTRIVVYDNAKDIPRLLQDVPTMPQAPPMSDGQASSEASRDDSASFEPEEVHDADEMDDEASSPDEEDMNIDHNVDLEAASLSVDVGPAYQAPAAPSLEEIAAARCIARAYRRLLTRRRAAPKKGLTEARARWFDVCRKVSEGMNPEYRRLFLGPLPHALVCLEGVVAYAADAKKSAQKRLKIVQHEEYERVSVDLDRAMRVSREGKRLKKLLEPDAVIHRKQDCSELKGLVTQLQTLLTSLPAGDSKKWDLDLKTAVKGIVMEKPPPKKQQKPSLVVEDDFDL